MKRRHVEHACADIPANARIHAALFQDMPDECRGGRFPVRAGNPDDFRAAALRQLLHRAGEELHIPDHRNIGHLREAHQTVRLWEAVWNSRRQDKRGKALPVALVQVRERNAGSFCFCAGFLAVIPGMDPCLTGLQGARSRKACPAEAVHRNVFSSIFGNRDHGVRATSA